MKPGEGVLHAVLITIYLGSRVFVLVWVWIVVKECNNILWLLVICIVINDNYQSLNTLINVSSCILIHSDYVTRCYLKWSIVSILFLYQLWMLLFLLIGLYLCPVIGSVSPSSWASRAVIWYLESIRDDLYPIPDR